MFQMKLIGNPPFYRLVSCQSHLQVVRQTAKILIAAAILPFFLPNYKDSFHNCKT